MNGTISIGGAERTIAEATPNWINEQLGSRQDHGGSTCVRISIHNQDVHVALATSACGSNGGGGGRAPNAQELRILELWEQHRLNLPDYPRGQLIAFVQELRRF